MRLDRSSPARSEQPGFRAAENRSLVTVFTPATPVHCDYEQAPDAPLQGRERQFRSAGCQASCGSPPGSTDKRLIAARPPPSSVVGSLGRRQSEPSPGNKQACTDEAQDVFRRGFYSRCSASAPFPGLMYRPVNAARCVMPPLMPRERHWPMASSDAIGDL